MKYTHLYKIKRSLRKQANVLTNEKKKKSPKDGHQPTQMQGPRIVLIAGTQRKNRELQVS